MTRAYILGLLKSAGSRYSFDNADFYLKNYLYNRNIAPELDITPVKIVRQRRSLRTLRDGSPENKPPACVTEPVWVTRV